MADSSFTLSDTHKAALQRQGVVLLYLHGSVASGTARQDSDADIAVYFEIQPEDPIKATTGILEGLNGFMPEREKDIAILNEASPLLKQAVASRGMLLFARSPDDDLRFQIRSMHEYESSRRIVRIGQASVMGRIGI
jgi:predicted nucleotidyltransferase